MNLDNVQIIPIEQLEINQVEIDDFFRNNLIPNDHINVEGDVWPRNLLDDPIEPQFLNHFNVEVVAENDLMYDSSSSDSSSYEEDDGDYELESSSSDEDMDVVDEYVGVLLNIDGSIQIDLSL
jgi:hypothetical protein